MESLRFITDLSVMRRTPEFKDIPLIQELSSQTQVEHMYVTLMMRARNECQQDPFMADPQAGMVLARMYRAYPYLLCSTDNLVPGLQQIESGMMFSERRGLLRLKEQVWMNRMTRGWGQAVKWYLITGMSAYLVFNIWVLYKRVGFYMEHSFDILDPDIDYLIERY